MYENIIDETEMNIAFLDIETNSIEELKDLINKYIDTYQDYKNRICKPINELKKIFGNNDQLIYKIKNEIWEKEKYNDILWIEYKRRFYSRFIKARERREQLQKDKRKEDVNIYLMEYRKQKKICDICQGIYYIKNKAKHYRTKKHIDFNNIVALD
jgi:hypothetical protein